jgi:single-stranded-DNA-specific exonuclease
MDLEGMRLEETTQAEGAARLARRWELQASESSAAREAAARLAAELLCPLGIAQLLISRGIEDSATARQFFEPTADDLHDPMLLLGMAAAVERIERAVRDGEPILIYGDYDVDGTTATALLKTAIERIASKERPAQVTYHVPHRIREGYGIQNNILGDAAQAGIRLIVSVDTGIRAFEAAIEAKALGLDLIVTDHHLPDNVEGNPEAVAVLNPAQAGCTYPFKLLCGAAVAFKLAHALLLAAAATAAERERLRSVLVPSFLKLVAIATVADSVPLIGENRVIVALGLRELINPVQPGLRALMEVAQIPPGRAPTATEVGFRLGPRINAAGRMDIAGDVVELLLTRDAERARSLAEKLNQLNDERRATEAQALAAIEHELAALRQETGRFPAECLVLDDALLEPKWHRGVLGILASRVVERTGRPALVITHEDGQAHGSGRSIEGFHLLDGLTAADTGQHEIFSRYGGHAHAVGFSMPSAKLALLRERMKTYATGRLTETLLRPPLRCDVAVGLDELTEEFAGWLDRCAPFGVGNPEPVFVLRDVALASAPRSIKETHVCLELRRPDGGIVKALGWSRSGGFEPDWVARCANLGLQGGSLVDLACKLKRSRDRPAGGLELELCEAMRR